MGKFPVYIQHNKLDCGPTCLRIVAKFYGKNIPIEKIRDKCNLSFSGASLLSLSEAAESFGFRTIGVNIPFSKLVREIPLPAIAYWKQRHFVVIYKIKKDKIYVSDPAFGIIVYNIEEFKNNWSMGNSDYSGILLLMEPSPEFYAIEDTAPKSLNLKILTSYFKSYKKYIYQLFFGLLLGSLIQLLFPFLTQSIVDYGINYRDISFLYIIIIAQFVLYFSKLTAEFIRNWILLHISTRMNVSLLTDYISKLIKLPLSFFDSRIIGDIIQRIEDEKRIETFLTTTTLDILFSLFNIILFSIVLLYYNTEIFLIFIVGSVFYVAWLLIFMKKRRDLDNKKFAQLSDNQSNLFQLISGMPEIKLNNWEKKKRWEWENIQAKLFKINISSLTLEQFQKTGGGVINEIKILLITFLAAKFVITGDMTLGMMLAIQYIIGQLNLPFNQLTALSYSTQNAKISLERFTEIYNLNDEEKTAGKIKSFDSNADIIINDLSFRYNKSSEKLVLANINTVIENSKITAIVGYSGSGKTTLLKLLLGFYPPEKGVINIGNYPLSSINYKTWREKCGVVLQDGYIFADSILNNIICSNENIDEKRLIEASRIANIFDFIQSLPLKFESKIGINGLGLSQGQKQRILIARAIYKQPSYLFFDEATNALDSTNEMSIMKNIMSQLKGRTITIIAHRLSTVKNADKIIVFNNGRIVETGNHYELLDNKSIYHQLITDQLNIESYKRYE